MVNFGSSKESEYWSFPLPPISPHVPAMKSSASSVDVRALKSQVQVATDMLRKLCPSSACTTCMSKIEGRVGLEILVSALRYRIKGMRGGFCKHFLRSFFLSWVGAKLCLMWKWIYSDSPLKKMYVYLFSLERFLSIFYFDLCCAFFKLVAELSEITQKCIATTKLDLKVNANNN